MNQKKSAWRCRKCLSQGLPYAPDWVTGYDVPEDPDAECEGCGERPPLDERQLAATRLLAAYVQQAAATAQPRRRPEVQRELVGKRAAAKMLGVNRSKTLEPLIASGRIRTVKFRGRILIPRAEIERISNSGDDALREFAAAANDGKRPPRPAARSKAAKVADPLDSWEPPERT